MNITKKDLIELKAPLGVPLLSNLNYSMELVGINTFNRIAFFLANVMHESGDFRWLEEIHDGSNYEFRKDLGNIQKGDGKLFKGRGILGVTGRFNHRAFTVWANSKGVLKDFVKEPQLLAKPDYACLSAVWYWQVNKLEKYADAGDFLNVCSIINTGRVQNPKKPHTINGYEDRLKKLDRVVSWLQTVLK